MAISQEMKSMIEVLKKYSKGLMKNNSSYKHYFAPDIPEKIMKKLISNFDSHLAVNSVIGFFDNTIFCTSKSGYIFTNDGFYYKYLGKALYFAYKDISSMYVEKGNLYMNLNNSSLSEYTLIDVFDLNILKKILEELSEIDASYGQSSFKTSGKVKKIDLPNDIQTKCHGIIHAASVACGGVGTGLAQIPASDNAVIVPIQITMIVSLGAVFELNITESAAKSIIASAGASIAGRTVSQFLVGWIPGIGNVINTATAAGITEAIGWIAVKNFYDRWVQDRNKGRYEGMKDGYTEASGEYERKLKKQADEFLNQIKNFEREREEYENLLSEYETYIEELERKNAAYEIIRDARNTYDALKNLKTA